MLLKTQKSNQKITIASFTGIEGTSIPEVIGLKVNELPVMEVIADQHLLVVADPVTGVSYQITEQQLKDAIAVEADFNSAIPSTVPIGAEDGAVYFPTQAGTYTNFLNNVGVPIVVTGTEGGLVYFIYNGTYWTKVVQAIDLAGYALDSEFQPVKEKADTTAEIIFIINGSDFVVADINGYAGLKLTSAGILKIATALANKFVVESDVDITRNIGFALCVNDSNKNLAFGVKNDGTVLSKRIEVQDIVITGTIIQPEGDTVGGFQGVYFIYGAPTEMLLLMSYGQSNSVGAGSPADPVTTTQIYDSLMFNGGPRPDPAVSNNFNSLVPLIEGGAGFSETPMSGCVETVIDSIEKVNFTHWQNKGWQFLCAAPGVGGVTIQALSKGGGTGYYERAISYSNYAIQRAAELDKTISAPIMLWTHGVADIAAGTTRTQYYDMLNQLIADYNSDIPPITSQKNTLMWIGNQESVQANNDQDKIFKAQFDVMISNPFFTLANPAYILHYEADNAHYKPDSDRIQGAYYGIMVHKWLTGNSKPYPLYPIRFTVTGNNIAIKFHVPVLPLKMDTTIVSSETNSGFRVLNSSNADIGITSVVITGDDTVTIACSSSPAGGKVLYARPATDSWVSFGSYQMPGARGNLRDSQGDKIIRYGNAMHNFCLTFNITI